MKPVSLATSKPFPVLTVWNTLPVHFYGARLMIIKPETTKSKGKASSRANRRIPSRIISIRLIN